MTLGLFLFVVNALVPSARGAPGAGFAIASFGSALLGAVVLALVHLALRRVLPV
ncbi:MAG: phage holin family protein [Candidatus Binatia bacterium]